MVQMEFIRMTEDCLQYTKGEVIYINISKAYILVKIEKVAIYDNFDYFDDYDDSNDEIDEEEISSLFKKVGEVY